MRVRLTRVIGGAQLRTDFVEGDAVYPPIEGRRFQMTAPALEPDFDGRIITTSEVIAVHGEGGFTTRNGSRYQVQLLEGTPCVN